MKLLVGTQPEMKAMGSVTRKVMPWLLNSFPDLIFDRQGVSHSSMFAVFAFFDLNQIVEVTVLVKAVAFVLKLEAQSVGPTQLINQLVTSPVAGIKLF